MKPISYLFLLIISPIFSCSPKEQSIFQEQNLFQAGDSGVHTFRIPALACTPQGTLIAICDARQDNSFDLPGNIDLAMRRSFDNGQNWEPMKFILDLPEGHGCGDPSLIVDRETGRVFCFFAYGPPGIGIHTSIPGSSSADNLKTQHVQYIFSDDQGTTWSKPVDLNPVIKDSSWQAYFAASGHGIQTRSGRLIQPLVVKADLDGSGKFQTHARNAFSDDHGKTWEVGKPAGIQIGETKVVELADGSIMQNMRNRSLKCRSISISLDSGYSFGTIWQDTTLIDPRCNASITRYSSTLYGDKENILLFTNPANLKGRKNLTVRLSYDEGKSWPVSQIVWSGPAAYSTMAVLPDGTVGLLYEKGEKRCSEGISFVRFSIPWIREASTKK